MKSPIILVDTNNLCHIAYHSFRHRLKVHSYYPTSIIYGVLTNVLLMSNKFNTNKFIWAIDSGFSYRKQIDSTYKSNRTTNTEVHQQIEFFSFNILKELGFKNIIKMPGYEADDIIAGYSKRIKGCIIASNDQDFYQCLSKINTIYNIRERKVITKALFRKEYNISPKQWKLVKAIGGCSSDCVKGVHGIGEKTAIKYLTNQLSITSSKYNNIKNSKKIIEKSLKLVSLPFVKNIKLPPLREDSLSIGKFKKTFEKYEMKFFLRNIRKWKDLIHL